MTNPGSEVLNPLAGVPVLGWLIGLLDEVLIQIGMTFWIRAFVEMIVAAFAAYFVLRLAVSRFLPWIGVAVVGPVTAAAEAVRVVLLVPDLVVSSVTRRFRRAPAEIVYGYGTVVMTFVDGLQDVARSVLPKLAITRKIQPWLLIVLLAALFMVWNNQKCTAGPDATCFSPVSAWTTAVGVWFDELDTGKPGS
jgi:hypothetical protein